MKTREKKSKPVDGSARESFPLPTVGPCTRCGAQWTPQKPEMPIRCAKCKSFYWREERRRPARSKKAKVS